MTQCERVLQYMQDFGSINPQQAISDLGVMRLAARVSDLRDIGYPVRRRMVNGRNRYNEKVSFAEYYLEEEQHEADARTTAPTAS